MNDGRLTLVQAWGRLRELSDRKPAYTIAQANASREGYCDFIGKDDHYYRLVSTDRGRVYSVRKL